MKRWHWLAIVFVVVIGIAATATHGPFRITGALTFEGATSDAYETALTVVDPTADRTVTLPDATGIVAFTAGPSFTGTVAFSGAIDANDTVDMATTVAFAGSVKIEGDGTTLIDLPYAEIYSASKTTTINTADTWTAAGGTYAYLYQNIGATASTTNGTITIDTGYAGRWLVILGGSATTSTATDVIQAVIAIDAVVQTNQCQSQIQVPVNSHEGATPISCLLYVDDGEALSVYFRNVNATNDIILTRLGLKVVRIGF